MDKGRPGLVSSSAWGSLSALARGGLLLRYCLGLLCCHGVPSLMAGYLVATGLRSFLAVHVFPPERPRPVLLLPLHGRQEHRRGPYWPSGARVACACSQPTHTGLLALYGADMGRTGRILEPLGYQGPFFTEFSASKNLGPHSVTGQKAPKLLDPPGGMGMDLGQRPA